MDELLKTEMEYTAKLIRDPSEMNRENLLNIKIKIIELLHQTDDKNIKRVCDEYYDDSKKKLYKQYEYFSNLREYLKKKQDVTVITNIIDSTLNDIYLRVPHSSNAY